MAIGPKILEELKAKHGDVALLTAKSGEEVVVRVPTGAEWDYFLDQREKIAARALKGLLLAVVVHPTAEEARALIGKKPGLAQVFGARVIELAGMEDEAQVKKY